MLIILNALLITPNITFEALQSRIGVDAKFRSKLLILIDQEYVVCAKFASTTYFLSQKGKELVTNYNNIIGIVKNLECVTHLE